MSGFVTADTQGRQVIDAHAIGRSEGLTAQSWAGAALASGGSLANSSSAQPHGNHQPADSRPGFLAQGQPGGHSAAVLVPGAEYSTANQIQAVAPNSGTAGGGREYPNSSGAAPVADPMVATGGWTAQHRR